MQDFLHYCQIPLDFHTSKQLSQTCGEFNANTWAEQLADAHVDSFSCFAQGHHGMTFYYTLAHAERARHTLTHPLIPHIPLQTNVNQPQSTETNITIL